MQKIFLLCALILIVGDFVCYADQLSTPLKEFANDPSNYYHGKTTSVFQKILSTAVPGFIIRFAGQIWTLADALLARIKTPKYEKRSDKERMCINDMVTITFRFFEEEKNNREKEVNQALGEYLPGMLSFDDNQIIANSKNIGCFFILFARTEFRRTAHTSEGVEQYLQQFATFSMKVLKALINADNIKELLIIWKNLDIVYDKNTWKETIKKDGVYTVLCVAARKIAEYIPSTPDIELHNVQKNVLKFLIKIIQHSHGLQHPDIQKATFENRFKLYLKASRKCLEKYRPIISIDAEFFDEAKVFKHVEAELDDPNFILLRFILDIEKYPVMADLEKKFLKYSFTLGLSAKSLTNQR